MSGLCQQCSLGGCCALVVADSIERGTVSWLCLGLGEEAGGI